MAISEITRQRMRNAKLKNPTRYWLGKVRIEILNGRTLCKECHLKTDTWGNKSLIRTQ